MIDGDETAPLEFLVQLPEIWSWVIDIFGTRDDYHSNLCAYYFAVNIRELADRIAGGEETFPSNEQGFPISVPLFCVSVDESIGERAYRILLRNPESTSAIWLKRNVSSVRMAAVWPLWIRQAQIWMRSACRHPMRSRIYHRNLLVDLGLTPKSASTAPD
jgi:hypothetical protein